MCAAELCRDRNGATVVVGSKVRLLCLDDEFLRSLPRGEVEDVKSMIGEVFRIYEIDEFGQAWIEKVWQVAEDQTMSHSLALDSREMELV